ncbi:MAG TPA: helix-hairpin-helix domain-containing protein, partial [Pyrinomonadaceae bacterium]|nr:helix-hairpin-helix domain-containing protein [Pyrinomonadaceae bacterium]
WQKFRARPRRFLQFIFLGWLLVAAGVSCVRMPRRTIGAAGQNAPPAARLETPSEALININTATREQLEKLPGIGPALAARIVEHRERYGRFRRAEHLLLVRGISERRYQTISALLTTE